MGKKWGVLGRPLFGVGHSQVWANVYKVVSGEDLCDGCHGCIGVGELMAIVREVGKGVVGYHLKCVPKQLWDRIIGDG